MGNKQSKTDIYFADFETLTKNSIQFQKQNHTGVFLSCFSHIDNEEYIIGKSLDEFFNQLFKDGKNKIIYFHNLSWDGHFIIKWLWRNYERFYEDEYNKSVSKNNNWSCFRDGNKIYRIDFKRMYKLNGKTKNVHITFMCTYLLFQNSVNVLAKSLGLSKHNINDYQQLKDLGYNINLDNLDTFYDLGGEQIWEPKHKALKNVFVEYIKNDVLVIKEFYKRFRKDFITDNEDSFNKRYNKDSIQLQNVLTLTQLDIKLVKNNVLNRGSRFKKIYKGLKLKDEEHYELARKFYSGGLTQFNPNVINQDIKTNALYIDINSSYPFSMTQLLPYGELSEGWEDDEENYINYIVVNAKITPKKGCESINFIKSSVKGERYTNNIFDTFYWTKKEYECLQQFYNFEIYDIVKYNAKAEAYLKPYIEKYYEKRRQAKLNKDTALTQLCKILLNSLYGSFCKKLHRDIMVFVPKKVYDEIKERRKVEQEVIINIGDKEFKLESVTLTKTPNNLYALNISEVDKEIKKYPNILIGATITSWSRINLMNAIFKIGVQNFLYCDTDSVFFKWDKNADELSKMVEIDNTKLGAWKIEEYARRVYFKGAKKYVIETDKGEIKSALSGAKKVFYSSYEEYKNIFQSDFIPSGKVSRKEDDYGIYLEISDVNISTGKL